jgi:hypothetical protein
MPTTPQAEYDQNNKELVSLKINIAEIIRSAGIIIFDDSLAAYRTLHPEQAQAKTLDIFLQEERYTAEVVAYVNERSRYDFRTEELYPLMCQALEGGEKLDNELWTDLVQDLERALWLARMWHSALGDVFGFYKT